MIKILFVCHGNICRSPMAEFVMKDLVKKAGLSDEFYIASAATSTEEIGNGVHYGTRKKLAEFGISVDGKYAVQLKKSDYAKYDYIIGMDSYNLRNMKRMLPNDLISYRFIDVKSFFFQIINQLLFVVCYSFYEIKPCKTLHKFVGQRNSNLTDFIYHL